VFGCSYEEVSMSQATMNTQFTNEGYADNNFIGKFCGGTAQRAVEGCS